MSVKAIKQKQKNALKKMKDPALIKHIIEEVQKEGVVGEENSIAILTLKICLRLVQDVTATSSNIFVSDESGGGKDWLVKNICKVMLDDNKTCYHRTDLSKKVLNYWELFEWVQTGKKGKNGKPQKEKKIISWDGKVLYLEDPGEDVIKSQGFKVRASGDNKVTVLKDQEVIDIRIVGKPVFIITSMKTSIDVEGTRRWDCIRIDTSKALTKEIMKYNLDKAAGKVTYTPDEYFRDYLKNLQRVEVVIPFASQLLNSFGKNIAMRTQVWKLIDYIKASVALHQYSRQQDANDRYVATEDDYEFARFVFTELRNMEGQALNKKEQDLMDYLTELGDLIKPADIVSNLQGYTKTWLQSHKEDLVERKLVSIEQKFDPDANREIEHWRAVETGFIKCLPSAKDVLNNNGYIASGQLYDDLDKIRAKRNLSLVFKRYKK